MVVVWQLTGEHAQRQQRALELIGLAFLGLALYILVQSSYSLLTEAHPDRSPIGTAWVSATVLAMLLLAAGKARVGRRLGNPVLQTEARVTLVDAYLAAAVLVGLLLNAALDWWWADPAAALVIVYYAAHEGRAARAAARSG